MARQRYNMLRNRWRTVVLVVLSCVTAQSTSCADELRNAAALKHFNDVVLPLLKKHCFECHSHDSGSAEGGLVLDSRAGWEIGGDSGPGVVPGNPEKSLLLDAVEYRNTDLQMPPEGKISSREIEALRRWIGDGAVDPRKTQHLPPKNEDTAVLSTPLWSLRPRKNVSVPDVDGVWSHHLRNDIDRFILAALLDRRIVPGSEANRFTLLRRAALDLTGLPPTLAEIDEFTNDDSTNAWQRLIDRLLDSKHYGERWARHWLDLARYGDSNGGDINYAHANAWRYRDYVVKAFNDDRPYDEFIREQLAGDLLVEQQSPLRRHELLTATGFLMLGPKMLAEVDTDKLLIDIVDEQLDTTGRTFLGMTFGCARCHDHKFDPITTEDYYAMAGIFRSTKVIDVLRPSNGVSEWLEVDVTTEATRATIQEFSDRKEALQQQLADLGESEPADQRGRTTAPKAIVASGLPTLISTTWSAWVRIDSPQTLGAVVSATYKGANQGHSLGFDRGMTPRIVWNHGSRPHTIIAAAKPVSFGDWHHLVLTFDAPSEQLKLFVNGRAAASASNVATTNFNLISVGRREASKEWQLDGDVDEVQIFDVVLNETQIQDLFERHSPSAQPLIHWSFDQKPGSTVIDEAGKFDGRPFGISAKLNRIEDGVLRAALTFAKSERPANAKHARKVNAIKKQIQQIEAATPPSVQVMAVAAAKPVDLPVHIRGNHLKLSEAAVPRSTPRVFDNVLKHVNVPARDNGRLQLANWIASPENPLTARVMVNRIWQHHFGHGLVRSNSNFGARGEQPSHPELLDWLAGEFIASGWSVKHMHRLIMNSAAYHRSSHVTSEARQHDPDNRLLAAYPVRRLEAEAIRDSLLAVSGELDRTVGGSLFSSTNKKRVTMTPNDAVYGSTRRSIYLPSVRVRSYEMFSVFDVSDSGQHVAQRAQTMVAQQALFLMNNPFVSERAAALAEQVSAVQGTFESRLDWLHRRLHGRPVHPGETEILKAAFTDIRRQAADTNADDAQRYSWQHLVHTMLCSNEFIRIQ